MSHAFYIAIGILVFCVIATVLLAAADGGGPAIDESLMVEAIRLTENTRRDWVGRNGERSEWQMKKGVWESYSTMEFWCASSPMDYCASEQLRVATEHVRWIIKVLPSLHASANDPYWVAMVWGAGYGAVQEMMLTPEKKAYARRVENTYDALVKIKNEQTPIHKISSP